MPALKLWEIASELDQIEALIHENGGELSPEIEAELDRLEGEFDAKAERVGLYFRELLASADVAKAEKDRLAGIERRFRNSAEGLRHYLHTQMRLLEIREIKTPRVSISVRQNPESIHVAGDPSTLPEEFRRVKVEADKAALKAAHKEGRELPAGVTVECGESLRIA